MPSGRVDTSRCGEPVALGVIVGMGYTTNQRMPNEVRRCELTSIGI